MKEWIRIAFAGRVVRRGLEYAVVVGAILILINHGDTIVAGSVTPPQYAKMGLTVAVPYCVSVLSSVAAILDMRDRRHAVSPGADRRGP
jgi:hypothetical protein